MLKSDKDQAMAQVIDTTLAALRMAGASLAGGGLAPYDPQTSGAAENAVKLTKGTLRDHLLSLERQLRTRIPLDHPILAWMVSY